MFVSLQITACAHWCSIDWFHWLNSSQGLLITLLLAQSLVRFPNCHECSKWVGEPELFSRHHPVSYHLFHSPQLQVHRWKFHPSWKCQISPLQRNFKICRSLRLCWTGYTKKWSKVGLLRIIFWICDWAKLWHHSLWPPDLTHSQASIWQSLLTSWSCECLQPDSPSQYVIFPDDQWW